MASGSTYGIQPSAVKWTSIIFIIFSICKDYTCTFEFYIIRHFICNHELNCGNKEITLQSVDYPFFTKLYFFLKLSTCRFIKTNTFQSKASV